MVVSCRTDVIMIAEHNETKVYGIMFLYEMHEEQVKIVAKNQCLVIEICNRVKIRAFRSGWLEWSKRSEKIGACNSTPDS